MSGRDGPRRLNPCPATIACETVKPDLLELLRISACELEAPACTFPKLMLAGLTVSWPWAMLVQQRIFRRRNIATFEDQRKRLTASPRCSVQTLHGGYGARHPQSASHVAPASESCSIWIVRRIPKDQKVTEVNSGRDYGSTGLLFFGNLREPDRGFSNGSPVRYCMGQFRSPLATFTAFFRGTLVQDLSKCRAMPGCSR